MDNPKELVKELRNRVQLYSIEYCIIPELTEAIVYRIIKEAQVVN